VLAGPGLDRVVVTNTIPPFRLDPELVRTKLVVLDVAGLFAEAIRRVHENGSLVELLEA
jgi:ribose-phosphate pyrophosphokinase